MTNESLFEKLQLQDERNLLIQGLPSSIEKQFVKLSYSKSVTPLLKTKKIDFALIFAVNHFQLCNILKDVFQALHENSKLWIAYPKVSSKIVSDLNRQSSWNVLTDSGYENVTEVNLDHVWQACRYQRNDAEITVDANLAESVVKEYLTEDFQKKVIIPPVELERLFVKHHKAKEFFTTLSVSHQKEYVSWIQSAKRGDTKKRRIEATLEKLLAGKKHPSEK